MCSLLQNLRTSLKIDQLLKSTNYSLHHHTTPNDHLVRLWGRPPRKPKNDTNRLVLINDQGRNPDPYYGHENMAHFCAHFITHLFACPKYPPTSSGSNTKLPNFITYALHRTKLHSLVMFAALVLLQQLKARFLIACGSSGHRLFISDLYHYFTRPGIWLGMSGPSTETNHKR